MVLRWRQAGRERPPPSEQFHGQNSGLRCGLREADGFKPGPSPLLEPGDRAALRPGPDLPRRDLEAELGGSSGPEVQRGSLSVRGRLLSEPEGPGGRHPL